MSPNGSTTPGKQVLYVDVDDEITTIIDKMNATSARVVALVLPKRASVFQSVVNMKLLKHRADSAKKNLVLITSEAGLMPLAGIVGIHVAPTLQSRPEIPAGPLGQAGQQGSLDDGAEETASMEDDDFDTAGAANTAVGALASQGSAGLKTPLTDVEDTIELDNTAKAGPLAFKGKAGNANSDGGNDKKAKKEQAKRDKNLKVPNFFSFRKKLLLGGLVIILLAIGWYFAYVVLPKATVTIVTDSSDINSTLDLTLDTAAGTVDTAKAVVPGQTKQEQKSNTQQVPATGTQNKGVKATGSVTLTNCSADGAAVSIPAGTGVSANGMTFITQKTIDLQTSTPGCKAFGGFTSADVNVVAQQAGTSYNINASTFTVAGFSNVQGTSSVAMTGGTDNNVKVVQQSDIDAAKQKLTAAQDQTAIKKQLQSELETDKLYAIPASFSAGTPNVNTNNNVGDEADNVTVTQSTTYTMFGVHKDDLSKLVEAAAMKQIDTSKQSLLNDGVDDARITVPSPGPGPQLKISLAATSTAGPKLDIEAIKNEIVGMKSGNVQDKIKENIGVKDVEVKYSPFWVTKAPKAGRTTVVFQKTGTSSGASNGADSNSGQ
jgi:hypothetical protein